MNNVYHDAFIVIHYIKIYIYIHITYIYMHMCLFLLQARAFVLSDFL